MRVAAMDVGSNSIHLVIAEVEPEGQFRVLDRAKEMVRLGRRSLTTGRLTKAAMDDGLRTVANFKKLAERQGATRFRAVATSAVREARNGGEFLQRIHDEVGLRVRVIPGPEEARLTYLGAAQAVDLRGEPSLILDIGGGSVELVLVEDGQPTAMHSLKLGVARLTEQFLESDPPRAPELKRLDKHLKQELDTVLEPMAARGVHRIVGTSGTMLTLVAMAANRRGAPPGTPVHNLSVPAAEVIEIDRVLRASDRDTRLRMRGMDAKRADLIVAGAALAARVARRVGAETVVGCTWALREGLIFDYIARHAKGIEESARFADVRKRSVVRLLRRLGQAPHHPEHVARLSLRLFDQLKARLALKDEAREWLEYASLLHDVGHVIGHENHAQHSHYLVVHGQLLGFTRDELEIVAQVARHHGRRGSPKPGGPGEFPLPASAWKTARALVAILRLAEGLDRGHYGAVTDVKVRTRGERVVLELLNDGQDAALPLWETRRRTDLMEKLLGAEIGIRLASRR